jgi:hypothetical protein
MPFRYLLAFAFATGISSAASAQFTTFIPPQTKAADSVKTAIAVQQRARADSIERVQLTNMKTWVDSAAGVVAPPVTTRADSLMGSPPDSLTRPQPVARAATTDTAPTLKNGARAPETASNLPLFALLGAMGLGIGTVMLAGTKLGRERA